jgi:hypothetical protein
MQYYTSAQLKQEFVVVAKFYQISVNNKLHLCRNEALIKRNESNANKLDAVVVMANPGSCSPIDTNYEVDVMHNNLSSTPFVPVKADSTQLQLMRLMKIMDWNVVSIINLSDLCAGQMKEFSEKLKEIESYNSKNHSIFTKDRIHERVSLLKRTNKIILAWGRHNSIRNLAYDAIRNMDMENHEIFGLRYSDTDWGYRHPNPMLKERCIIWLKDMREELNKDEPIHLK